ncbi:hypothetical protein MCEMSEM29_00456 [Methylophilaceae bacterium]
MSMNTLTDNTASIPHQNHLLAAMSEKEWHQLEPDMEPVDFSQNQVL